MDAGTITGGPLAGCWDDGPMPAFSLNLETPAPGETLALYDSVGWSAYTRDPADLDRALRNSSFVVAARDEGGELIGLARTVSDDSSICYVQDILVKPELHGAGVGRALMQAVLTRYAHVRQVVLITDDEPGQRAFYEAMGFAEGTDVAGGPLRMFALFR
jgi:GNAT superfamily N-acetyltransferase